jgi:hypothetical protein
MEEIEKIKQELEKTIAAKKEAANLMDFEKVAELTKKQMELKEKLKKSE